MTRNSESRFSHLPGVEIERSKFKRPFQHKTTFNAGDLIPIFCDEVLPGDTFSLDMSSLVRMSTPIFPTMDNAFLDTYFFFVPNRLLWEHWKEFNGENSSGYWTQQIEYQIPQLTSPNSSENGDFDGWQKGDLADYFGIPTKVPGLSVNALPFRAYVAVWNEWFRDQSTMQPAYFTKTDSDSAGETWQQYLSDGSADFDSALLSALYGAKPLPVSKYHDYFTSCLPQPQKGPAVDLPLYQDNIPVYTGPVRDNQGFGNYPSLVFGCGNDEFQGSALGLTAVNDNNYRLDVADDSNPQRLYDANLYPNNLYADVSNVAVATISQLRQAFQLQRLYEKDARGGKKSLCLHVKKIAEKIWKTVFYWLIRGEGICQPQRIGNEITFPRGRDTFIVKRYAELY